MLSRWRGGGPTGDSRLAGPQRIGVVGAGGIGSLLSRVFDQRDWDRIGIALIVIILVTMIVDAISGAVRHRIIAGAPTGSAGAVV